MAAGFIDNLLRRQPDLPPEVREVAGRVARLVEKRPTLGPLLSELSDLLAALYAEPSQEPIPVIDPAEAAARLASGVPLLRNASLSIDQAAFRRRWQRLTTALKPRRPDAAPELAAALRHGKLDANWLVNEVLAGRPQVVHARAEELELDVSLTATVVWMALFPVLSQVRLGLQPLRRGAVWREGFCPTCGAWPKVGEFRGLEQTRFLRCSLCADDWEFARLRCPFCGNADHRQLGFLHIEGEEMRYRAVTCDACRHYVKMVATLTARAAEPVGRRRGDDAPRPCSRRTRLCATGVTASRTTHPQDVMAATSAPHQRIVKSGNCFALWDHRCAASHRPARFGQQGVAMSGPCHHFFGVLGALHRTVSAARCLLEIGSQRCSVNRPKGLRRSPRSPATSVGDRMTKQDMCTGTWTPANAGDLHGVLDPPRQAPREPESYEPR